MAERAAGRAQSICLRRWLRHELLGDPWELDEPTDAQYGDRGRQRRVGGGTGSTCEGCPPSGLAPEGLFRWVSEILPSDLPDQTEFTLFSLEPAASIRARWQSGMLQVKTVLAGADSPWQTLVGGEPSQPLSAEGRFEVELSCAQQTGSPWGNSGEVDTFRVRWVPPSAPPLTWELTATGVGGWHTLRIGAFNADPDDPSLEPQGQVWVDNFEWLKHSLGGNPL